MPTALPPACSPRAFVAGPQLRLVGVVVGMCTLLAASVVVPQAQQASAYRHLNPVIDKLSQGKTVIGAITSDLSVENARSLARSDIDYVYLDLEHSPLRMREVEYFMSAMIDLETIMKKGITQPNVAVFARLPPFSREGAEWIVKQTLDLGLHGVMFNAMETKDQALKFVASMRKFPKRGAQHAGPIGTRGSGGGPAAWFWGVSGAEYSERADVWPLNPRGDLMMIPMMETIAGVKNAAEIASVPGVSAMYIPAGGDLSTSLGVASSHPEVEEAKQVVLQACRAHKVICGSAARNPADVARRIKEGFKMLNVGHVDGGLTHEAHLAVSAARTALKAAGE